jgi:hypothetical protein
MFHTIRSIGVNIAPIPKANMHITIYFMVFIVFLAFVVQNIFNSIVISSFNTQRERISGDYLLNDS